MPDSLGAIIKDWLDWLGPDGAFTCKVCHQEFTAPENSNSGVVSVCRECWYKEQR